MPVPHKIWTLAEANAALPGVRALLARVRKHLSDLRGAEAQLRDLRTVWGDQVLSVTCPDHQEFLHHVGRFNTHRDLYLEAFEQFAAGDIELKDPDTGLVDFRGQLGTRTVLLCWREGEATVSHYHELDTGFQGRKPIPSLQGL
ncbi:MAG TPA: DUF2203 domain-containing protein [Candidatus Thermoplasmatota archaeon]|nr:DUF2203 domain-containing protein [Candidatus Thermoplasmatota archaeon]